jgi:MFS family permease
MFPCAFAHNIQTMLIARFLDGLAGSAFLSVAGGTVGDMFAKHVGSPVISYSLVG